MLLVDGLKVRVVNLPQGTEFTVANIGAFDVRAKRVLGQRLVALGGQFVPVSSVRPGGPDFRVWRACLGYSTSCAFTPARKGR